MTRFNRVVIIGMLCLSACSNIPIDNNDGTSSMAEQQRNVAAAAINVRLGLAYLERNQRLRAKEKLLQAVEQNPNSSTALDALAYYWQLTGNDQQAEVYYKKAIHLSPNSGRVLNNYGVYLCRTYRFQAAESYFLAAANEPTYLDTAAAYENAGLCALEIPNYQKAAIYFQKVLQQDPNRPTAYFELANIFYMQKNYIAAQKYLADYQIIAITPTPESLWLGIQIAKKLNNASEIKKNGLILQRKFPKSKQYQLYQKMQLS